MLEDYTKARTRTALTGSLAVKVDKVWVVKDGVDTLVDMKDVQVDDLVRIRSGSMIPVDGRVIEGEAFVNESTMTGESKAVMKTAGRIVFAGTVLEEGAILVKVHAVNSNTKIQKIVELIDREEFTKDPIGAYEDRIYCKAAPMKTASTRPR